MLERYSYDNERYFINPEDERIVTLKNTEHMSEYEKQRRIENALDSFEEGYNGLTSYNGSLYEIQEDYCVKIMRRAYLQEA